MTVDTKALRESASEADRHANNSCTNGLHCPALRSLARRSRAAADELDELRAHCVELATALASDQSDHETTRKELHDQRARLEAADTLLRRVRWLKTNNGESFASVCYAIRDYFARYGGK